MTCEDLRKTRGRGIVVAVNSMVFMAPFADILYAADSGWWREYRAKLKACPFNGRRVSVSKPAKNYGASEILPVGPVNAKGLGRGIINRGGNSGYQAINLAFNEGAKEIVLLGFDMAHTFGKRHCHDNHPQGMGNAEGVDHWLRQFPQLAADLEVEGVRVVNCTRYSRLKCFPRMSIEDLLNESG
jgi:hypothetical protein